MREHIDMMSGRTLEADSHAQGRSLNKLTEKKGGRGDAEAGKHVSDVKPARENWMFSPSLPLGPWITVHLRHLMGYQDDRDARDCLQDHREASCQLFALRIRRCIEQHDWRVIACPSVMYAKDPG